MAMLPLLEAWSPSSGWGPRKPILGQPGGRKLLGPPQMATCAVQRRRTCPSGRGLGQAACARASRARGLVAVR